MENGDESLLAYAPDCLNHSTFLMQPIRIAYPMRVDALDSPGGDLLQVQKYIAAGAHTSPLFTGELIVDLNADLTTFDIVHLTNMDRPAELYHYCTRAIKARKPVVLSPIHHSYSEIERFEREARLGAIGLASQHLNFSKLEILRSVLRCRTYPNLWRPLLKLLLRGTRQAQRFVLTAADRILLLTDKEREDLETDIGLVHPGKAIRLCNGFPAPPFSDQCDTNPIRDLDVCVVGRIEARKNQNAILAALNRLGCTGIFIGKENPHHRNYCAEFKEGITRSKSQYLGALSHSETVAIMRRSKVHVSASWFEVSSLVDIEAFYAGCSVVSSASGGTQELLGDNARYVDPGSPLEIEEAIRAALEESGAIRAKRQNKLTPPIDTWESVGNALAVIYREIVDQHTTNSRRPAYLGQRASVLATD